jgi:protein-S-isoprenylcysteine O-methyltransferase Ste14
VTISEHFRRSGDWLFRKRSFLPLLLVVPAIAALAHYTYPLGSHIADELLEVACLAVCFLGLGIRALTVGCTPSGTSGRNTRDHAASTLNTAGMYSVVRHPLYLGNFIIWIGLSMFLHTWWLTVIVALAFWLYYERIIYAEEAFLQEKFGSAFTEWANRTPMFVPRLCNWRRSELPFSFRKVLRKEYTGFYGIILVLACFEFAGDAILNHKPHLDTPWVVMLVIGTAAYTTLRILKKKTQLLREKPNSRVQEAR